MPEPTESPSRRRGERGRTYRLLVAVSVLSALAFGYGFAVFAGLLRTTLFFAIVEYSLLVVGGLVSTLTALAAVWLWRQEQPHPITGSEAVLMSSIAFAMPLGAVLLSEQLRLGEFTISRVFGWTTVGVVVLGSQFAVGAIKPNQRMWRLLLGECGVVYAGLFAVLVFSDGGVSLAATLYLAGVGSLLFLAFGGPLYLLGHHLSDASR